MIEAGCVRVLDNLSQRKKWGDADLEENIETLSTALRENIADMSSFDVYKAEITSGELDWTPVHRTEKFWRDNINRFSENDNEVLGYVGAHYVLVVCNTLLNRTRFSLCLCLFVCCCCCSGCSCCGS
jgi:hypothetical protein